MKVKCITNKFEDLLEATVLLVGYPKGYEFDLQIGSEHTVYGIFSISGRVSYLLFDRDEMPFWYPAELFEVTNYFLPPIFGYNFKTYNGENNSRYYMMAVGYEEMVSDLDYHDKLIELEPEELAVFKKRKKEIDEFEQLFDDENSLNKIDYL